ncbi:MAG: MlaE family lipid ABC transporter permease subunit [Betaproteobacteria bacterium]
MPADTRDLPPPSQRLVVTSDDGVVTLTGALDAVSVSAVRRTLKASAKSTARRIDVAGLTELDTAGALLLQSCEANGDTLVGLRAEHKRLIKLISGLDRKAPVPAPKTHIARGFVVSVGRAAATILKDTADFIDFTGRAAASVGYLMLHPGAIRFSAIAHHITETGVKALPIVGLLAVMISIVIAYQGVAQLRPYGGQDLMINLVSVSVLREMAVLITAILVAGRSGAAFAAEIGVMKSSEEIDALKVMGLDPMQLLVAPRLIALLITLPLLTFFADMLGLIGGALISQSLLDISFAQYVLRVREAVDRGDLFVGLVKAPVFAIVIAITGCMHGLRVKGSAESLGTETTLAVVKSIFLVIVLDALFSIFFEKVGI